jgi:hypothetical protein
MINAESVTFTIIGDPNISGSASRQVAEIIITDQGAGIYHLSLAFDACNGAPRSTLLEVATNGHNTIESVMYQTIGNETTYSIRYKYFKLYASGQVSIPRWGNVSVESRGNDVTEGESLGVDFAFPPMQLGVEYRTTERWNGKVVYAKSVNIGTLPDTAQKTIEVGIDGSKRYEIHGHAADHPLSHGVAFPSNEIVGYIGNDGVLYLTTLGNFSSYDATVTIKYIKD